MAYGRRHGSYDPNPMLRESPDYYGAVAGPLTAAYQQQQRQQGNVRYNPNYQEPEDPLAGLPQEERMRRASEAETARLSAMGEAYGYTVTKLDPKEEARVRAEVVQQIAAGGGGGNAGDMGRLLSGVTGQVTPPRRVSPSEMKLSRVRDAQYVQDQERVAKLFSDPKSGLTEEARADILNQMKTKYPDKSFFNPIDVQRAQDEQTPEVAVAGARQKIRELPDYEPVMEEFIDPETKMFDWKALNTHRETSFKLRTEQTARLDKELQRKDKEFDQEATALEVLKPDPLPKEYTPADVENRRTQQLAYIEALRNARARIYGPAAPTTPPVDGEPQPTVQAAIPSIPAAEAKDIADSMGALFVSSSDEFDRLVQGGELSPGEAFVDDEGAVWIMQSDGTPKRAE